MENIRRVNVDETSTTLNVEYDNFKKFQWKLKETKDMSRLINTMEKCTSYYAYISSRLEVT